MTPLKWGLSGAFFCALLGAGYGTWWYYSPEHREAYIQETLAQPHMDSQRYMVSVLAWRYRTWKSLILQYAPTGALLGFGVGILAGKLREEIQQGSKSKNSPQHVSRFTLLELLAQLALCALVVSLLLPSTFNYGLVYYEGKDQIHWLMRLEHGTEPQKREAVTALSMLLERPPFPCRSTIIPALGNSGAVAEPAIPVLSELCEDDEAPIREAAKTAIAEIQQAVKNTRLTKE